MISLHLNFPSYSIRRNVEMNALIPLCAEEDYMNGRITAGQKYKTLYLLHGFGGNCSDWLLNTRIAWYAQQHNMAVIMPSGENSFYLDHEDLQTEYAVFVGKELVEMTRALFPLSDRKEDTLIGGLSMGGYGAIHTGLAYPETFGTIFAFSSALIQNQVIQMKEDYKSPMADYSYYKSTFGDTASLQNSEKNPEVLAKKLKSAGAEFPRIYLACGTEDFLLKENREFHQYLEELQICHEYVEGPGIHDFNFWDEYIQKALDWYDQKTAEK